MNVFTKHYMAVCQWFIDDANRKKPSAMGSNGKAAGGSGKGGG